MPPSIAAIMKKARRVLLRRGASAEDVDDLVQEAFARIKAYSRDHVVETEEALVVRTAVNLAIDAARRNRRAPFDATQFNLEAAVDSAPRPDEVLRARERLNRLKDGLMRLSPRARRVLLAQRLDGLSYKEIAVREGVSLSAVEKQIARSVAFLTDWMQGW